MRDDQLQQLNQLWEKHMQAMKLYIQTGERVALEQAERIAEQMKQIRERRDQDPAGDRIGHAVPSHLGPDTSKEWA